MFVYPKDIVESKTMADEEVVTYKLKVNEVSEAIKKTKQLCGTIGKAMTAEDKAAHNFAIRFQLPIPLPGNGFKEGFGHLQFPLFYRRV